jgi:hypothetical protein
MNDAAEKPRHNQRTEYMKTSFFLAAAAVAVLAAVNTVSADEALLSPRAKANQPSRISRSGIDPDLVRGQNDPGVAAQAKASGAHSMIAGASKNDPDLVRAQAAKTGSPKGLEQLHENGRDFQVAPVK